MAIVLEDFDTSGSNADVTTLDCVLPGGAPTNNWVLIGVAARRSFTDTGMTITGPTGFTDKVNANTMVDAISSGRIYIKYKVASSDPDTFTFTNGGTDTSEEIVAGVWAYSGMSTTDFTGATDLDNHNVGATSSPSLSVTTTGTNSIIFHGIAFANGGGVSEWPITGVSYTNSFTALATVDPRVADTDVGMQVGSRITTSAAAHATVASWTQPNTTPFCTVMAEFFGTSSSPPINTVPTSSGQCFQLDTATPITSGDEPTVAAGSSAITSVTLAATAGLTLTLDNTGTSVTFTGNGTNNVVLENGASATEYNTVLATINYTATTRGKKTIMITTSDGTLSDADSWCVLAAVRGISITGTHAQVKACYESLNSSGYGMVLDVGETSGTVTVYAEDDTSPTPLTDTQIITLNETSSGSTGILTLVKRRRRKRHVI